MGHYRWMLNQAFHAPKTLGKREDPAPLQYAARILQITLKRNCDHSAKRLHLLCGKRVLRMRAKTGINDAVHARMSGEPFRKFLRIPAMLRHSQVKRLQSPQSQKRIERTCNGPDGVLQERQ